MAAIEVAGVTKTYGDVVANEEVSFAVERGEVFGYLGPNGAGKTTTIRTLLGFLRPTDGGARLLGQDVTDGSALRDAKERVGYLPSQPAFDGEATGRQVLDLHAAVKGDERRAELLELFEPPLDRPIRAYSTGNVQKLGIVQAFMHDPEVVVLDEPTSGLDPLLVRSFADFLRAERDDGLAVLLSSHVLGEVRRLCDRVGILRGGRLIETAPVAELLHRTGKVVRATLAGDVAAGAIDLEGVHDLERHARDADLEGHPTDRTAADTVTDLRFTFTGDVDALLERLTDWTVLDCDLEEAPLEEVFLRYYGGED